MAGSLDFNGTTDDVRFALTTVNPTAAVTQLLVIKPDVVGDDTYLSAAGYDPELGHDNGVLYYRSATITVAGTAATSPTAGAWQIIAVTKAAGSARPRFHRVLIGGAAAHEDANATVANRTAAAPWVLGGDGNRGAWQMDGRCAAWATWDRALTDREIEACTSWAGIVALAPLDGGVRLDGDPPFARQTAINGTTHSADEPAGFWPQPPPTPIVRVRERMPLAVHATGVAPNGNQWRWAKDEADPTSRPSGMRWSDTMPGGFDRAGCVLPRKPGIDYSDLQRLSTITFRDVGGGVVWEGRLERAPRSSGEQMSVSPDLAGWQAHLEDDRSASVVFRDLDLGRWQGPGAQRRLNMANANAPHQSDAAQSWDTGAGAPALVFTVQGQWSSPQLPHSSAWYDAGAGNRIASIRGRFQGWNDATWNLVAWVSNDAVATSVEGSGDVYGASTGSFTFSPTARYRYGLIQWSPSSAPGGGDGAEFPCKVFDLAVYGDHGIAEQAGGGFLASDIVAYTLGRWAPLLRFSIGQNGTIQPTSFVIPQAAFHDPTTAAAIVQEVIKYELPDWAVWENRTFWMHRRGAQGRHWRARVAASGLEETGPQIDRMRNGILVQFQGVDGSTRVVGPPGSGADLEDPLLLDQDPSNPVNQLNMRRWDVLNMGIVSTPAAAVQVGARFLAEARQLDTSGRAVLVGYVEDANGVEWPYHAVRAGDTISFVDAADPSPRRITQAEKDADARSCTVSLDSPPEGLDALLARLGVVLSPYGL